jgi:hypothetical protein
MRAFHPITHRVEAERDRNHWTAPSAVRRLAWCAFFGALAYGLFVGWQMTLYILEVNSNPDYMFTHPWPGSPLQMVALFVVLICIPVVSTPGPRPKKKHIPDPALSIRPR